jgi:hypothetical protein
MSLKLKDMTKWMAVSCTEFALVSGDVGRPLCDVATQKLYFFIMEPTVAKAAANMFLRLIDRSSIDRYVCTIRVPTSRVLNEKENTRTKQGCKQMQGGGSDCGWGGYGYGIFGSTAGYNFPSPNRCRELIAEARLSSFLDLLYGREREDTSKQRL